ncbi:MAG: Hpt domain-containing protein [Treponema sp.]|nr:Hpt domain-containing protein [Treponema sp.]
MDLALVFSQLIRIDGLDIWEGLTHVGCNQEVYAEALRNFCRDLESKCAILKEFLQKENWKDYSAAAHAIKGGLAGIGAWELSQKTRELEDAARDEDYEFCINKSDEVLKRLEQFTGVLKSTALFTGETTEKEQVSIDYLEKKLGELYFFCSSGSSVEADMLARELRTKTCGGETGNIVDAICTYVENLDYHLVIQILAKQPYIKTKQTAGQ